jgi:putative transposase
LTEEPLSIAQQYRLAGVNRATHYAHRLTKPVAEEDRLIRRLIDEEYTRHPFFGSRRRVMFLQARGWRVNRQRVQPLMEPLGLAGLVPGPHTSQPHPAHGVYPYLRRGLDVAHPNPVWSTDITIFGGFGALCIGWQSLTGTAGRYWLGD